MSEEVESKCQMVVTIVDHEQDKEFVTIRILQSIKFMLQME